MENIDLLLNKAKLHVKDLKSRLVSRTDPADISFIAKIPVKALTVFETLRYRATDLADAACVLIDDENVVSAACITRAFQETFAVLFCVNRKVKKAISDKNVCALNEDLMKVLISAKNIPETRKPINILTMIDRVNKEIPDFRLVYDNLSEVSHPNWAGTLGLYSKVNKEKVWTDLGRNIRRKDEIVSEIVILLSIGLELMIHIYEEFLAFIPDLTEICEEDIQKNSRT